MPGALRALDVSFVAAPSGAQLRSTVGCSYLRVCRGILLGFTACKFSRLNQDPPDITTSADPIEDWHPIPEFFFLFFQLWWVPFFSFFFVRFLPVLSELLCSAVLSYGLQDVSAWLLRSLANMGQPTDIEHEVVLSCFIYRTLLMIETTNQDMMMIDAPTRILGLGGAVKQASWACWLLEGSLLNNQWNSMPWQTVLVGFSELRSWPLGQGIPVRPEMAGDFEYETIHWGWFDNFEPYAVGEKGFFSSLLEDWIHWPLPYGVNEERHDFLSSAEPAGAFDSSDFKRFETWHNKVTNVVNPMP